MARWTQPKTDWVATDRFNIGDFNRIKNNLTHLHDESEKIYGEYGISDMGNDLVSYSRYWSVDRFNQFEQNLKTINEHMLKWDIGITQTFYENGKFIGYAELNRIEGACLTLKTLINGWYEAMPVLSFRLGNKRIGSDRLLRKDVVVSLTIDSSAVESQVIGEPLDLTGVTVTATWRSGETAEVTADCTFEPAIGTILTEKGTQTIRVSYTDEATVTGSFKITVNSFKIVSWANGTDAQIQAMLDAHYAGEIDVTEIWNIGDERTVDIPEFTYDDFDTQPAQSITWVLAHPKVPHIKGENSDMQYYDKECAFAIVAKTGLAVREPYETRQWYGSPYERMNYFLGAVYNRLPDGFRGFLQRYQILLAEGRAFYSYIGLISEKEFFGTNAYGSEEDNSSIRYYVTQFDYYKDEEIRWNNRGSWFRNKAKNYTDRFVLSSGYSSQHMAFPETAVYTNKLFIIPYVLI